MDRETVIPQDLLHSRHKVMLPRMRAGAGAVKRRAGESSCRGPKGSLTLLVLTLYFWSLMLSMVFSKGTDLHMTEPLQTKVLGKKKKYRQLHKDLFTCDYVRFSCYRVKLEISQVPNSK